MTLLPKIGKICDLDLDDPLYEKKIRALHDACKILNWENLPSPENPNARFVVRIFYRLGENNPNAKKYKSYAVVRSGFIRKCNVRRDHADYASAYLCRRYVYN